MVISPESVSHGPTQPPLVVLLGASELAKALRKNGLRVSSLKRLGSILRPTRNQDARLILIGPEAVRDVELASTLPKIRGVWPLVDVVLWSPRASGSTVRAALNAGAKDVVLKVAPESVAKEVRGIVDSQQLLPKAAQLEPPSGQPASFEGLLTRNRRMWDLFDTAVQMAASDATVLILGETGTGKELLARAVHRRSQRPGRFVAINCGAVNENLIDAELFGYEKGAFTGATKDKEGLFRHAEQGTLMLDEVGNIPLAAQYRLLRVLQEGAVRPVGANRENEVNVRVIAATSNALEDDVQRGRFREDLFYRLDVLRLEIPPLRERRNDIIFLFGHFAKRISEQYNIGRPEVSDGFLDALTQHDWPGNVRQLENFTERLVLTHHDQMVTAESFQQLIPFRRREVDTQPQRNPVPEESDPTDMLSQTLSDHVDPLVQREERRYLEMCLEHHRGRINEAAEHAGINRRTLLRKLKAHGIDKRDFRVPPQSEDS